MKLVRVSPEAEGRDNEKRNLHRGDDVEGVEDTSRRSSVEICLGL